MASSTTNYNLIKPDYEDNADIKDLNDNFDTIDTAMNNKVDKETGKGLSTNDFTTAEKTKLDGLAEVKSIGTGLNLDSTTGELTATGGGGGTTVNNATITIQKNGTTVDSFTSNQATDKTINITVPTSAADVSALPDTTKYAAALSLTINSSTYVMTGQLKDQNGDNIGTAQTIDLPLESVVVGGSYNSQTKKVVLTLQNGNTIEFSVADLVSGLQTELSASNKLNPAYINYDSAHRAVSDTEKSTWNGKQNAIDSSHKLSADLVDDTNATNKFATAEELEQIQTNKSNILLMQSNHGVLKDDTTLIRTDWTLTSLVLEAPVNSTVFMSAALLWGAKAPRGIRICRSNTSPTTGVIASIEVSDDNGQISTQGVGVKLNSVNTYYVWAKAKEASTNVPAYLFYDIH